MKGILFNQRKKKKKKVYHSNTIFKILRKHDRHSAIN